VAFQSASEHFSFSEAKWLRIVRRAPFASLAPANWQIQVHFPPNGGSLATSGCSFSHSRRLILPSARKVVSR
jgi:hypothetical protein